MSVTNKKYHAMNEKVDKLSRYCVLEEGIGERDEVNELPFYRGLREYSVYLSCSTT